jgi:uncharacterized membrane protein YeaQ/YmgE (transglycosylase-associated protein family)
VPGPTLTFAFILATLLGAAFHLIVGGDARRLALFLLAGWVGFGVGHVVGIALKVDLFDIGTLHVFPATLGALLALVVALLMTTSRFRKRVTR